MKSTKNIIIVSLATMYALAMPLMVKAQDKDRKEAVVYIQQTWPAQTSTNKQISDISSMLQTEPGLKDWSDKMNLNIGGDIRSPIGKGFYFGGRFDYSTGKIKQTVDAQTPYGPSKLHFNQEFSYYLDALAIVKKNFGNGRIKPFLLAGTGFFASKDNTLVDLEGLGDFSVSNKSFAPTSLVEGGIDVNMGKRFFFETAGGYQWGHFSKEQPATGTLAPIFAPTGRVPADNNINGPFYRVGAGLRF
jgi:hypothetical protein